MITLAVAAAFQTLASQLFEITGGEDGLTFRLPELLSPSHEFAEDPFLGVSLDGRLLTYYLLFVTAVVLVLALLRIVNSPFGRVLQAIRENEFRAEAIGYRVVVYRTHVERAVCVVCHAWPAPCWRSGCATTDRTPRCRFEIMIDVLLIVVIGGMGTIYGAAIGAVLFLDRTKLPAGPAAPGQRGCQRPARWLAALLSPDRWLLWLGLLFVLSVYYFPDRRRGRLRAIARAHCG
jgi:branched-chain amino acid transport system permease protein